MTGRIHAADPDRSKRLQRVLGLLSDGREHSTLDIVRTAGVCAVNSIAAELRAAGHNIRCTQSVENGARIFRYRLLRGPAQMELIA